MKKSNLLIILFLAFSVFFTTCTEMENYGQSNSARSYLGTQNPGDVWVWTIDTTGGTGTFSAVNEETTYTYEGDVETLPNGFLKLTITDTTHPGLTLPAYAYALEFQDNVLLIKPAGPNPEVIVAVALGDCPGEDTVYNWIKLLSDEIDSAADEAYGISSSEVSGSDISFTHTRYTLDGTVYGGGPVTDTGFSCADGRITRTSVPTDVIAVTPAGLFVFDKGYGNGGVIGMKQPVADVSISDLLLSGREFRGILFQPEESVGDTKPVWLRPDPANPGQMIGGEYEDDFEAGTEQTDNSTISFTSQDDPGIVNAVLTSSHSLVFDIIFMINRIDGKYFLYGVYETEDGYGGYFLAIEL